MYKFMEKFVPAAIDEKGANMLHKKAWKAQAVKMTSDEVEDYRDRLACLYYPAVVPGNQELRREFLYRDKYRGLLWVTLATIAAFVIFTLVVPVGYTEDKVLTAVVMLVVGGFIVGQFWGLFKRDWKTDYAAMDAAIREEVSKDPLDAALELQWYGLDVPEYIAIEAGMPVKPRPTKRHAA